MWEFRDFHGSDKETIKAWKREGGKENKEHEEDESNGNKDCDWPSGERANSPTHATHMYKYISFPFLPVPSAVLLFFTHTIAHGSWFPAQVSTFYACTSGSIPFFSNKVQV